MKVFFPTFEKEEVENFKSSVEQGPTLILLDPYQCILLDQLFTPEVRGSMPVGTQGKVLCLHFMRSTNQRDLRDSRNIGKHLKKKLILNSCLEILITYSCIKTLD